MAIAALADAKKVMLAARQVLRWHGAEPGGQVPRFAALKPIAYRGDQCGCTKGADAWHDHEPTYRLIIVSNRLDLAGQLVNVLFQLRQVTKRPLQQGAHSGSQITVGICQMSVDIAVKTAGADAHGFISPVRCESSCLG